MKSRCVHGKLEDILFFKMGYSKTAEPALKFAKKLSEETGYELLMLWDQETWFDECGHAEIWREFSKKSAWKIRLEMA